MTWYIIIGVISGVISGMGVGGGTLLIPALVIFFDVNQQTAQSINLLYFMPTATAALVVHVKKGNIAKIGVLKLILYGLVFAAIGSFVAIRINSDILKKTFGCFLLLMGIYEFFRKDNKKAENEK